MILIILSFFVVLADGKPHAMPAIQFEGARAQETCHTKLAEVMKMFDGDDKVLRYFGDCVELKKFEGNPA